MFSDTSESSESDSGLFKDDDRRQYIGLNQPATATSPNSFTNVRKSINFDSELKQDDQVLRMCRAKPGQYLGQVDQHEDDA